MASQEGVKLNFYSKYNRVRDKRDIQTLYMLIDDKEYWLRHYDNLTFTLNCSRVDTNRADSPIQNYHSSSKDRKQKSNLVLSILEEDEKNDKLREMEQKLRKLQRLERNFHEELERRALQYNQKKQLKEAKKKQRQYYQKQLINIEHISEHSQNAPNQPFSNKPNMVSSQIVDDQIISDQFQDHYMEQIEINDQNESEFDVKETKRKLKEILQMQKQRHKEVESVEQNNQVKTASIVIERMNFMPKINQNLKRSIIVGGNNTQPKQHKETNNLYQIELNHSQSEKAIWNIRPHQQEINDQNLEPQANQMNYKESEGGLQSEVHYQNDVRFQGQHEEYDEHNQYESQQHEQNEDTEMDGNYNQATQQYQSNLNYDEYHEQFHSSHQTPQEYQEIQGEDNVSQQIYAVSDNYTPKPGEINYNYYEHHNEVDPPLTLAQEANNQFGAEDTSEINEEINDHVVSIGDLSQQQSQPPNPAGNIRNPLFLSQTNPRKTFQSQHQVQSIAQSLDFHPLQNQHPVQQGSKYHIHHYGQKEEKGKNQYKGDGDKKNSFKKLMADNRSNLVPRLAISTILNEHINEVLGDYKANQAPPPMLANLHESIISSQANSSIRPGKINFKQMLRRNKKNPSTGRDKTVINKDPEKVQTNKKLLMSFFDQN